MKLTRVAVLIGVISAACSRDAPNTELAGNPPPDEVRRDSVFLASYSASRATRVAFAKRVSWRVGFDSVGPLYPGMTLARAILDMEGDLWTRDISVSCSYFRSARAPGMKFLFLNRHLARIEIDAGATATVEGVKIGATEEEIQAAYPGRVTVTPDKYTEGHYLSVSAADASDSVHKIVFETDGKRTTRFRSGILPAVEWVEGCS